MIVGLQGCRKLLLLGQSISQVIKRLGRIPRFLIGGCRIGVTTGSEPGIPAPEWIGKRFGCSHKLALTIELHSFACLDVGGLTQRDGEADKEKPAPAKGKDQQQERHHQPIAEIDRPELLLAAVLTLSVWCLQQAVYVGKIGVCTD